MLYIEDYLYINLSTDYLILMNLEIGTTIVCLGF